MDRSSQEQLPKISSLEQSQRDLNEIFERINLAQYFSPKNGNETDQYKVASFGAGSALEAKPLNDYFLAYGLGKPEIIAYDRDDSQKKNS